MESIDNVVFVFPLKGLVVGMEREYSIQEIPSNSCVYVNRILDNEALDYFKSIRGELEERVNSIIFEDLGLYWALKESNSHIKCIFAPSHALCSELARDVYLEYMDKAIISPDLTIEETKNIINDKTGVYLYGHLPVMYSRRFLVSNYEKVNDLEITDTLTIHEPIKKKDFFLVENEYGTVVYDNGIYNGNELLGDAPFYLINLEWIKISSLGDFLKSLEEEPPTYTGFLHEKTIYKLPPREDV